MSRQRLSMFSEWRDLGPRNAALYVGDIIVASVSRMRASRNNPTPFRVEVLGNNFVVDNQPSMDSAKFAAMCEAAQRLHRISKLLGR